MVHSLMSFSKRSILLFLGICLTISFEKLEAAFNTEDTSKPVLLVRNTLNPDKHFLAGEDMIYGKCDEERAYKRALAKAETDLNFPFFADKIFFSYDPRITAENIAFPYECIMVNPKGINVYNKAFRINLHREDKIQDKKDYCDSCMPLSEYITQQKVSQAMEEKLKPGEIILYHPLKFFPFIAYENAICADTVSISSHEFPKRWKLRHFQFQNEIPIQKSNIPTFKQSQQNFGKKEAFSSVICRKFCTTVRRCIR